MKTVLTALEIRNNQAIQGTLDELALKEVEEKIEHGKDYSTEIDLMRLLDNKMEFFESVIGVNKVGDLDDELYDELYFALGAKITCIYEKRC